MILLKHKFIVRFSNKAFAIKYPIRRKYEIILSLDSRCKGIIKLKSTASLFSNIPNIKLNQIKLNFFKNQIKIKQKILLFK